MASTYSDLKIELIGTGEQTGTWGTTTNNNLSIALSEAITGSADVAFSSADVTVTLTNTNAAQAARNLRLNLTGTSGGARQLILGSGCQIEKLYLINNGLADAVTVKNTSGTGIAVPAGRTMFVYNNGTNVVDAVTYLSSLTLGTALPVASGGTGSTSTTYVNLASNVTGTLPIANGGTGATTLAGANIAVTNAANTFSANQIVSVTDNSNAALRITQLGTGNALLVEDSANPDSSPFVIDANGVVSIGVSQGTDSLNINQNGRNYLNLGRASDNGLSSVFANYKSRGTYASRTIVQSNDAIGAQEYFGWDGAAYITAASIIAAVDGTPGTNDMPGRLVFSTTADGASSPTERMRIDNAGQVGIGGNAFAGVTMRVTKAITGSATSYGAYFDGQIGSTVTTANIINTGPTQAAGGTLASLRHFFAEQGTLSGTVTNQFGYAVGSSLTGATNNFGFHSNIPAGAGRWNFYANGTADNYFAGNVGIGTTTTTNKLEIGGSGNSLMRILASGQANGLEIGQLTADGSSKIFAANNNFLAFGTNNTERIRITSAGAISVGSSGTATGTAGQVLTSAGTGAPPTWSSPSSISVGQVFYMSNN
jgi:hypothetical protein